MFERNNSPIFSKTYDLLLWLNNHTGHFPKSERFRLAKRIEDAAFDFYDNLLQAVGSAADLSALSRADYELTRLRFLVRLAKDRQFSTQAQYAHCMGMIVEIGRLLGSWIKHTHQPQS